MKKMFQKRDQLQPALIFQLQVMFECLQNVVEVIVQSRVPIPITPSVRPSGAALSPRTAARSRNRVSSIVKGWDTLPLDSSFTIFFDFVYTLAASLLFLLSIVDDSL